MEVKISVARDDNLYISDLLCWLSGFLAGKGEDFKDYDLIANAMERLRGLNIQIKRSVRNNDKDEYATLTLPDPPQEDKEQKSVEEIDQKAKEWDGFKKPVAFPVNKDDNNA